MIVIYLEEKARFALRFSRNGHSGRTDKFLRRKFLGDFKINERQKVLIENFIENDNSETFKKEFLFEENRKFKFSFADSVRTF